MFVGIIHVHTWCIVANLKKVYYIFRLASKYCVWWRLGNMKKKTQWNEVLRDVSTLEHSFSESLIIQEENWNENHNWGHVYVFMRKRRLFCSFSPSVHTQTLIQRFRKRVWKWRLSKTLRCRVDGRKQRLLKTVLIWKRIRVDVAWDVFWYRGKGHSQIKPQFYLDFLFINTDSFQKPYKELRIRSSLLHFPWFKNFNAKRIC